MLLKVSIINHFCSFELSIDQRILKISQFPQKYWAAQLFTALIIIYINVSWAPNEHDNWFLKDHMALKTIVMTAENSAAITGINYYYYYCVYCDSISDYYCFFLCFDQINAALINYKKLLSQTFKNLTEPKHLNSVHNYTKCNFQKWAPIIIIGNYSLHFC